MKFGMKIRQCATNVAVTVDFPDWREAAIPIRDCAVAFVMYAPCQGSKGPPMDACANSIWFGMQPSSLIGSKFFNFKSSSWRISRSMSCILRSFIRRRS